MNHRVPRHGRQSIRITEMIGRTLTHYKVIAELGFPKYEMGSWQGMFAPAGTPKFVVDKLGGEVVRMLKTPDIRQKIERDGSDPLGTTPEEFTERVKSEIAKWTSGSKEAGLQSPN